jgi:hypothetical protein
VKGQNFMRSELHGERGHVARLFRHSAETLSELSEYLDAGNMPANAGRMPALPL